MLKRFLPLLMLALAGCATMADGSPAEAAARICPPALAAVSVLSAPGALDDDAAAEVRAAGQVVGAVCDVGDVGQVGSLRDVLPLLRRVLELAPIDPADKSAAVIGLAVAEAVFGAMP